MSHSPDYTTLRHRPIAALLLSLAAVSAVFLLFPGPDLAVSRLFYFPGGGFVLADDPALELLRNLGKLATIAVILAIVAALLAPGLAGRFLPGLMPSKALYLLAIYAIGPGLIVNAFFKQVFGRARPYELLEFSGDLAFSHVWAVSDACSGNCSFTSGEASAAAALMAIVVLLPKNLRLPIGGLIAFFAALVSLNRIAFGGHFLSDTVLSWLVVLFVVDLLRPWFFGTRGVAIDAFFARAAMRVAPLHRPSLKGHVANFPLIPLVTLFGDFHASNDGERCDDPERDRLETEAPVKGSLQGPVFRGLADRAGRHVVPALSAELSRSGGNVRRTASRSIIRPSTDGS